jgi:hypothetical protein
MVSGRDQAQAESRRPGHVPDEIGKDADFKLNNNGTADELKNQVDEMMTRMRS